MLRLAAATLARSAASSSKGALMSARPSMISQSRAVLPSIATQSRGYHEKVIDHYENPRNVSWPRRRRGGAVSLPEQCSVETAKMEREDALRGGAEGSSCRIGNSLAWLAPAPPSRHPHHRLLIDCWVLVLLAACLHHSCSSFASFIDYSHPSPHSGRLL